MFASRPDFKKPVPAEITSVAQAIFTGQEVAFHNRMADPFGIESACTSPGGHVFIADRESIVCQHCSRMVWP